MHFHYTSVPRYTHMTIGMEVQRNTDGDTPSNFHPVLDFDEYFRSDVE